MPLCRLLEYVRTIFPAEGQRQRDTDCALFTLALGGLGFDDDLVTDVTFDCFESLLFDFLTVGGGFAVTLGVVFGVRGSFFAD